MPPQIIFGTATFGMPPFSFQTPEDVQSLLTTLKSLNIAHLDTAARYPPMNPGKSEELIGQVQELSKEFVVDTKCYTDTKTDGSGDLSTERMDSSVTKSLESLKREKVHVLYAHRADPATPLEDQIRTFNEQVSNGRCEAWGVSNFTPSVMEKLLKICDEKGLHKPKYYQGVYNAIARSMERKLLPLLRAHNVAFTGYVPLAAGFLTGKFVNDTTEGTRFDENTPLGQHFSARLNEKAELLTAMQKFVDKVSEKGLTPTEVSLRWLAHHSALREHDGMIVGASRVVQIVDTVDLISKGKLENEVVELVEELWKGAESAHLELLWGNGMD